MYINIYEVFQENFDFSKIKKSKHYATYMPSFHKWCYVLAIPELLDNYNFGASHLYQYNDGHFEIGTCRKYIIQVPDEEVEEVKIQLNLYIKSQEDFKNFLIKNWRRVFEVLDFVNYIEDEEMKKLLK